MDVRTASTAPLTVPSPFITPPFNRRPSRSPGNEERGGGPIGAAVAEGIVWMRHQLKCAEGAPSDSGGVRDGHGYLEQGAPGGGQPGYRSRLVPEVDRDAAPRGEPAAGDEDPRAPGPRSRRDGDQ